MSTQTHSLEVATIRQHCKALRLPSIAEGCERLAEEAIRHRHTHLHFLDALLLAEVEERQARAVAQLSLAFPTPAVGGAPHDDAAGEWTACLQHGERVPPGNQRRCR